jgi:AcrR family transcriptional regulator
LAESTFLIRETARLSAELKTGRPVKLRFVPKPARTRKAGQDQSTKGPAKNKRRQAEVLDAAVQAFYERGYSETSVGDIADQLGILKGSLYYYIESKEDLLYEIVRDVNDDVAALLASAIADEQLPPLERLANYIVAQVEYNTTNIKKITVYHDDLPLLGSRRLKEIRRTLREIGAGVTVLIVEAQERGDIDASVDPALASYAVFATLNLIYRWYKPRGRLRPPEISEFLAEFVLNGLTGVRMPTALANRGAGQPA